MDRDFYWFDHQIENTIKRLFVYNWIDFIDIIWIPVSDNLNREYLFLTYGPSSRMEYPNNWNKRMKIWDETIQTLFENTDEEIKSEIDFDAKNELNTATPDPILDIY